MIKHARRRFAEVVATLSVTVVSSAVLAQTGPDLMLKPWPKGELIEVSADVVWLDDGSTSNGDQFRLKFFESNGRVRLLPDQRADPRFGYSLTHLDIDTNDPGIPSQLTDVSAGVGFGIADVDGWLAGLTLSVGYAAAGAFNDGNGYYGRADLLIGRTMSNGDSLGFVIDYDGNRTIYPDIPLPGFLYLRRLDPTLLLGVGFPYSSIAWKPDKSQTWDRQLTIEARYDIPDDANVQIDYELIEHFSVFATYAARREAFHVDEFDNDKRRLLFQQRRVEGGARWTPFKQFSMIGALGYAFSQELNIGWDTRDQNRVAAPSDEPYLRFGLEFRY